MLFRLFCVRQISIRWFPSGWERGVISSRLTVRLAESLLPGALQSAQISLFRGLIDILYCTKSPRKIVLSLTIMRRDWTAWKVNWQSTISPFFNLFSNFLTGEVTVLILAHPYSNKSRLLQHNWLLLHRVWKGSQSLHNMQIRFTPNSGEELAVLFSPPVFEQVNVSTIWLANYTTWMKSQPIQM